MLHHVSRVYFLMIILYYILYVRGKLQRQIQTFLERLILACWYGNSSCICDYSWNFSVKLNPFLFFLRIMWANENRPHGPTFSLVYSVLCDSRAAQRHYGHTSGAPSLFPKDRLLFSPYALRHTYIQTAAAISDRFLACKACLFPRGLLDNFKLN